MRKILHLFAVCSILFLSSCKTNNNAEEKYELEGVEEEHEDGMEKWFEQNRIMTQDPALGYVPTERLVAAQEYTTSLMSNTALRTNSLAWTERGPNNVGGRTRAIIVDKRDATGNTVFAGSVGGGIWKCTNFKSSNYTWTLLTPDISNMAITALAQDPSNLNTFYAGTGEGWFNSDAIYGNGIYKSTDGGVTWVRLTSTYNATTPLSSDFNFVQDIVVTNTGIVFVACSGYYCNYGGIQRSSDGGTTFTRVVGVFSGGSSCSAAVNLRGADLEIAANGDIYATTGFGSTTFPGKIFKTLASLGSNIGASGNWTDVTPAGTWQRIEIATAPSNANVIYALCQNGSTSSIGGIRRSDDGGATWLPFSNPTWCNQGSTSSDFTNSQCWYDLSAAVDPNTPTTFFMGGVDMIKTVDGGTNWNQVTQWASGCAGGYPNIHADNHNITFINGSSNDIISGTDGGIYYSANAGLSWSSKNIGYNVTQFYAADFHPINTNYFLAGAQDNGSHALNSAGLGASTRVTGGDGAYCHIDQTDGNIQVTSYVYNNYYYSRNGGSNFSTVSGGTSNTGWFINPTEYDDALDVLYTSAAASTYGLVNGLSGTAAPAYSVVNLADLGGRRVSAIAVDPNVAGGGTVWFAGYLASGAPVFVKVSGANTSSPTIITSYLPTTFTTGSYVSSIDIEKGNANHLLATVSGYGTKSVMESTDGGATWVSVEGNLPDMPVRWGIFAPSDGLLTSSTTGGGIILATETGIWCTSGATSGTATVWTPQNTGLGNVTSYMVKYRASDRTLVVATHGRGVFTTTIPSVATGVNTLQNTKGFITYVSANSSTLFIKAGTLIGVKNMQVNVLDMQGRTVLTEKVNYNNQSLPVNKLPTGSYVVKIYGSNKEQYTQQFVK